jgi:hypothetical protein
MKIMIGFRTSTEFKEFLQAAAEKETRTLSNFIEHALKTYIEEHYKTTWKEPKKPKK